MTEAIWKSMLEGIYSGRRYIEKDRKPRECKGDSVTTPLKGSTRGHKA